MPTSRRVAERAAAAGLVGAVLFNEPLMDLAGPAPSLFVYVFAAWALVVALLALATRRPRRPPDRPSG